MPRRRDRGRGSSQGTKLEGSTSPNTEPETTDLPATTSKSQNDSQEKDKNKTQEVNDNVEDSASEDESPSNFRQIPVLPTITDIATNKKPFLRKNVVDGNYQSVDHYLDTHFRLIRENHVAPLRQAIHDYASGKYNKSNYTFICSNVIIGKSVYKSEGILFEISFTPSMPIKAELQTAYRLLPGSLMYLSADNFQSVVCGTVYELVTNQHKQEILLVKFEHEENEVLKLTKINRSLLYVAVALRTNVNVYRNVLKGFHLINSENMPLKEYIVSCQCYTDPPQYLCHDTIFDLTSVNTLQPLKDPGTRANKIEKLCETPHEVGSIKESESSQVCILDFRKWPSDEELNLDTSQRRALHFALTSSLAIIQGAPGTGKTFLAHKIVKTLLINRKAWQSQTETAHLLLIFLTTSALDQFLAEMTGNTIKLVRIAGTSKEDILNQYNIYNLLQENERCLLETLRQELGQIKGKIEEQQAKLQLLEYNILHEGELQELTGADGELVSSLTSDFYKMFGVQSADTIGLPTSFLTAWLGLTFNNCVSEEDLENFYQDVESNVQDIDDARKAEQTPAKQIAEVSRSFKHDSKTDADMYDEDSEVEILLPAQVATNIESFFVPISRASWAVHIQSIADPFEHFSEEVTLGAMKIPTYLALGHMKKEIAVREVKKNQEFDDASVKVIKNVWLLPLSDRWSLYRRWVTIYRQARMNEIRRLEAEYIAATHRLSDCTKDCKLSVLQQSDIIFTTITGATCYRELLHEINTKIGTHVAVGEGATGMEDTEKKVSFIAAAAPSPQVGHGFLQHAVANVDGILVFLSSSIVQEAEGILESHLVSVLSPLVEHLILIGDCQQCRPKVSVEELAKDYKLDVSLVERLMKNRVRHETLEVQHRMGPNISNLLVSLKYPELKSHSSVQNYANIEGLTNNVFFVNHDFPYEESVPVNSARQFEAEFLLGVCTYLMQQGYKPQAITILTLCPWQVSVLLDLLTKETFRGVNVMTVENYKGKENDIILLTMASDNLSKKSFFSHTGSRISIALSSARKGLYCCGNLGYLSKKSQFCRKLTDTLEKSGSIGTKLELKCQNHPNYKQSVACRDDFRRLFPRGRCLQICGVMQPCGHHCQQACHVDGHSDCTYVMKVFPACGHSMLLACSQDISNVKCLTEVTRTFKKCGHTKVLECHMDVRFQKCTVQVKRTRSQCQHKVLVECSTNPDTIVCSENCDYRLDCGHQCPRVCHPMEDPAHITILCTKPCQMKVCERDHRCKMRCCEPCNICHIMVEKELLCGHKERIFCHQDVQSITIVCKKPCKRILGCGHPCKQVCSDPCGTCNVIVEKPLPDCGHTAKLLCTFNIDLAKCSEPCNRLLPCGHVCPNKCCDPCSQQCEQVVSYTMKICGHISTVPCHTLKTTKTTTVVCQALCRQLLPCEHECKGLCGECRQGRVHVPCREACGRILICGHQCETPCSQECMPCKRVCENRCVHSRCQKKCGQHCKRCWEACAWQCPHYKCDKYCHELCTRPRCDKLCFRPLNCGHSCIGLCGEICPTLCRVCNKDELTEFVLDGKEEDDNSRFIQLEDCGHCIEVKAMDRYMDMGEDEIQMKCCPRCRTTIWRSLRYGNVIRRIITDVQAVKKKLFGSTRILRNRMSDLQNILASKGIMELDFPDEVLHLHHRLINQAVLHQNELVVIENQINMLELMTKMRAKTNMMMMEAKNYFVAEVKLLAKRLMHNEERITEHELNEINCEIRRLFLVAATIDAEKKLARRKVVPFSVNLDEAKQILDRGSVLTHTEEKAIEAILEEALRLKGGLGISDQERVEIVKAMGFRSGHWYKCPNGHIYAITNCGRAMQMSSCNECGALIGGQKHTLLPDNAHAREMDRR